MSYSGCPIKTCTTLYKPYSTLKLDILTKYVQFDRRDLHLDFETYFLKTKRKLTELRELEDRNGINPEDRGSCQF